MQCKKTFCQIFWETTTSVWLAMLLAVWLFAKIPPGEFLSNYRETVLLSGLIGLPITLARWVRTGALKDHPPTSGVSSYAGNKKRAS